MIKVTPEQMDQTAARLRSGADQIDSLLAQLRSQVEELRAGGWQGMASDQFGSTMQAWDQGGRQIREALSSISGAVSQSANQYRQTEQAVAGTFGS
jgi:WXG100 family type VII secretion target